MMTAGTLKALSEIQCWFWLGQWKLALHPAVLPSLQHTFLLHCNWGTGQTSSVQLPELTALLFRVDYSFRCFSWGARWNRTPETPSACTLLLEGYCNSWSPSWLTLAGSMWHPLLLSPFLLLLIPWWASRVHGLRWSNQHCFTLN